MPTDEELLAFLRNAKSQRIAVLALLLMLPQPAKPADITVLGFRTGFRDVDRWNLSDVLRKAALDGQVAQLPSGWKVLQPGVNLLRKAGLLLEAPLITEIRHDLRKHLAQVADAERRRFLEEAIGCFDAGHPRAAIVLSWVGAAHILQEHIVTHHLVAFNAAGVSRFPKSFKPIRNIRDFGPLTEEEILQLCQDASILSKAEKQELKERLGLRNRCGHPNPLLVEEHVAASHLATLPKNVYARF